MSRCQVENKCYNTPVLFQNLQRTSKRKMSRRTFRHAGLLKPGFPTKCWYQLRAGRVPCDLCPRFFQLHEGQQGRCFVRARQDNQVILTTHRRCSGFPSIPSRKSPSIFSRPALQCSLLDQQVEILPADSVKANRCALGIFRMNNRQLFHASEKKSLRE